MPNLAENIAYWNEGAKSDPMFVVANHRSQEHWELTGMADARNVANLDSDHASHDVLEWGCGSGRMVVGLASLFRSVIAVDFAPEMVALTRALGLPNVTAEVIDGVSLLLPDQSIDVVCSYLCWMHLPKSALPEIIASCYRVLKPGGLLAFQLPAYATGTELPSPLGLACWTEPELSVLLSGRFTDVCIQANPGTFGDGPIGPNHFRNHTARRA